MIESPVTEGEFRTDSELMLWRPGVDRARLRWRAMWTRMSAMPAASAGLGVWVAVLGVHTAPRPTGYLLVFVGVLLVGAGILSIWVNYRCVDYDHQHGPDKPCFLDTVHGRFFYRGSDFNDLPPSIVYSVGRIITAVRDIYASPTVAWLDPRQLRDIHLVAWDVLRVLDQTRTLREVMDDPRSDAVSDDLIHAQSQLEVVDNAVTRVLTCLHHAVALVRAWEQKLAETEVRARLRVELDNMPEGMIDATLRRAESLPENIFAYVTAARDVADAGAFEWERAQP